MDMSSKQNLITPVVDCSNEKSCSELPSIDLCAAVEDTNQKEVCGVDNNNCDVSKDDETNKNVGANKDLSKPKSPPVPVKTIKNITKPKTSNKQKPVSFYDETKVKPNSKHNKLNNLEKKNINKRYI